MKKNYVAIAIGLAVVLNCLVLIILPIIFHKELIVAAFYGYLTVAVSTAVLLIVVAFKDYTLKDYLFYVRAQTESAGFWGRLRWIWYFAIVSPIVNGLNWPAFLVVLLLSQRSVRKAQGAGGREREMVTHVRSLCEPVYAIVPLIEIGICYALVDLQPRQLGYARAVVSILCVAILVRLVQHLQKEGGLLAGLRAIPGSPLVRFIVILFANYVALVLGISACVTWMKQPHVSAETIRKVAISLTSLADVKNRIVPGPASVKLHALEAMSFNDVLLSVATLLFYFVLLRSILRFKEFARKDDDYASIAHILTTRGRYQEALGQLQKIRVMSATHESYKIGPNLGLGRIDRAYAMAERWLQSQDDSLTVSPEAVYSALIMTAIANYSLPTKSMIAMLEGAQKSKCVDSMMASAVMALASLDQLTPAECRMAFTAGTETQYPLTHAMILVCEENHSEALEMLDHSTSTVPSDQLMKMTYLLLFGMPAKIQQGEDPGQLAKDWIAANFDHYRALCDLCVENWNEEIVLGLVAPMCSLPAAVSLLAERFQELRAEIEKRIREKPGGDQRGFYLNQVLGASQRIYETA